MTIDNLTLIPDHETAPIARDAAGYYMADEQWLAADGKTILDRRKGLGLDRDPIGGACLDLSGSGQLAYSPSTSIANFNLGESFSISIWFNSSFLSSGGSNNGLVLNRTTGTSTSPGYSLVSNNGGISFRFADGTSFVDLNAGSFRNDGNWHHVVVIYDSVANQLLMFIDSALVDSAGTSGLSGSTIPSNVNFAVGGLKVSGSSYHHFTGKVWDARVYPGALKTAEVVELFQLREKALPSKQAVIHWRLESNSLSTIYGCDTTSGDAVLENATAATRYIGPDVPGSACDSMGYTDVAGTRIPVSTDGKTDANGGALAYTGDVPKNLQLAESHCLTFDGSDDRIDLGNLPDYQITGDLTIEFWIRIDSLAARCNPLSKSYGGEYTITIETNGVLVFFFGSAGSDNSPYEVIRSTHRLVAGTSVHVAIVRNTTLQTCTWYVNGEVDSVHPYLIVPASSTLPVIIGDGFVGKFPGSIWDVRVWNVARPVNQLGVKSTTTEGLVIDIPFSEGSGSETYDRISKTATTISDGQSSNWGQTQDKSHPNLRYGFGELDRHDPDIAFFTGESTAGPTPGTYRIYSSAGVNSYVRLVFGVTSGTYRVRGEVLSMVGANGIRLGDYGPSITSVGPFDISGFAPSPNTSVIIKRISGVTDVMVRIDSIIEEGVKVPGSGDGVTDVLGNPLTNPPVVGLNGAETVIDLTPIKHMVGLGNLPDEHKFGDPLPAGLTLDVQTSVQESKLLLANEVS